MLNRIDHYFVLYRCLHIDTTPIAVAIWWIRLGSYMRFSKLHCFSKFCEQAFLHVSRDEMTIYWQHVDLMATLKSRQRPHAEILALLCLAMAWFRPVLSISTRASTLSGWTLYRNISWRFDVIMIGSLWNLTRHLDSAAVEAGKAHTSIVRLRDFTRSYGKTLGV